jgi:hypothetical protein
MSAVAAWAVSLLTTYLGCGLWYHQWLRADAIGGVGVLTAILLIVWTPILYVPFFRWTVRARRPIRSSRLVARLLLATAAMALMPTAALVALFSASPRAFLLGMTTTTAAFYASVFGTFGVCFAIGLLWLYRADPERSI